ncbi:MAG: porin family protein [Verrucomicrobia bacterium]|nr:porin family protein [Verrucomicrobiota bacterium]
MRKIVLLSVAVSLISFTSWAANGWGIYGAYWDAGDAADGVGLGLRIDIEMVPSVNLQVRAAYFNDLADDVSGIDVDLEVIPIEFGLAMLMPVSEAADFYVGAGLGYYRFNLDINAPGPVSKDPDNELGYYMVAGFEAKISDNGADYGKVDTSLFGEFKYTMVTIDEVSLGGAAADVDLDGPGFNLGLMIRW